MSEETEQMLQQMTEANETLQEEISRLRRTNTMLRGVNGALRRANSSLRRQADLAVENDEMFKQLCDSGFGATVAEETGGLPESSVVESVG